MVYKYMEIIMANVEIVEWKLMNSRWSTPYERCTIKTVIKLDTQLLLWSLKLIMIKVHNVRTIHWIKRDP